MWVAIADALADSIARLARDPEVRAASLHARARYWRARSAANSRRAAEIEPTSPSRARALRARAERQWSRSVSLSRSAREVLVS